MRHVVPSLVLVVTLTPATALAWDDHSLAARYALAALPEVVDYPDVQVEPLLVFLEAEQEGLAKLLADEEAWAMATVPTYPAQPAELVFEVGVEDLQRRFLEALRVAPDVKLALYRKAAYDGQPPAEGSLPWAEVTTLSDPGALGHATLVALASGERVPALEVVVSACDEPDYGFDLGTWEDNDTEWGPRYGMGPQPFGDPTKEYSSQAPWHMGFYQEADIIYSLAGFLGRTYPEVRVHQYQSLARYAFETGHDYWGWRFTGWALHYVQDLTMPYHARVLPGVGTGSMLWINFLSVIGMPGSADDALRLVSNRHMTFEYYVRESLEDALRTGAPHPLLDAVADSSGDARFGSFDDAYLRHTLTVESNSRANDIDEVLASSVPERLVSDPAYIVDETETDVSTLGEVRETMPESEAVLNEALAPTLGSFGAHTRVFVRTLRADLPVPEPLPAPEAEEPEDPEEAEEAEEPA